MSSALELRRKRVASALEGDVDLPSGGTATLKLPDLKKHLLSGDIPMPVMQMMEKANTATDLDLKDLREIAELSERLIRETVVALDGEPVDLSGEDIDALFTIEDQQELSAYIQRQKPLPGKA